MARTFIAAGSADEPFDSEQLAELRKTIARIASQVQIALPEVARMQAAVDLALRGPLVSMQKTMIKIEPPKLDMAEIGGAKELVRRVAESMPSTRAIAAMAPSVQISEQFRASLLTTFPSIDLAELDGFERLAEGLAVRPEDVDALEDLANEVEGLLPGTASVQAADDVASLMDPELVEWAVRVEPDSAGKDAMSEAGDSDDRIRLRNHIAEVAAWLYSSAATLRAGVLRAEGKVDAFNARFERYEKLITNLLKLYCALMVVVHLLE